MNMSSVNYWLKRLDAEELKLIEYRQWNDRFLYLYQKNGLKGNWPRLGRRDTDNRLYKLRKLRRDFFRVCRLRLV